MCQDSGSIIMSADLSGSGRAWLMGRNHAANTRDIVSSRVTPNERQKFTDWDDADNSINDVLSSNSVSGGSGLETNLDGTNINGSTNMMQMNNHDLKYDGKSRWIKVKTMSLSSSRTNQLENRPQLVQQTSSGLPQSATENGDLLAIE